MKTMRKYIWICMILLVLVAGAAMGGVEERPVPVSGPYRELSTKELNDLERKAEQGDIEAIKCLFNYYVFEDSKKAVILARKGARLGDARLSYHLGLMLIWNTDSKLREEGIAALKESANQNYTLAQKELARCYEQGRGVPKNLLESEKWFRKAAMQGNLIAMVEVVRLLAASARDISTLNEAYGWTSLILKRMSSDVKQPLANKMHLAQRDILPKAKGFSVNEKQFISRSEEWARKQDVNIPTTDPWDVGEEPCKYLNMLRR